MLLLNNIRNILIAVAVIAVFGGGMYFWGTKSCVPDHSTPIEVTIPSVGVVHTKPITFTHVKEVPLFINNKEVKIDSVYYHKYISEKSDHEKLKLFVEAIQVKDTTVTLVDNDTIKLEVTSKTRGQLLSQFAKYNIKSRKIGSVVVKHGGPKYKLYIGAGLLSPTNNLNAPLALTGNLLLHRYKQDDIFTIGYDTRGYISATYYYRIFNNKK